MILRKTFLINCVFWLQLLCASLCMDITRQFKYDELSCIDEVDCGIFDAVSVPENNKSCICVGTFFFHNNRVKCVRNIEQIEGCDFHFKQLQREIDAITIQPMILDYRLEVDTGSSCTTTIIKVETYGKNLTWEQTKTDFHMKGSYIKWIDTNSINPSLYTGQLLKFHINCTSGASSRSSCLISKIIGKRRWTGFNFCKHEVEEMITASPENSSITPTFSTKSVLMTKAITPPEMEISNGVETAGLVGGIIAAVIVLVLIICCRRSKNNAKNNGKQKLENGISSIFKEESFDIAVIDKTQSQKLVTSVNADPHEQLQEIYYEIYPNTYKYDKDVLLSNDGIYRSLDEENYESLLLSLTPNLQDYQRLSIIQEVDSQDEDVNE